MSEEKKALFLNSREQQLMVRGLNDLRNRQIQNNGPTEDVEELLLKVIDAPNRKERLRRRYAER